MKIKNRLKALLAKKEKSGVWLAKQVGVNQMSVSLWVRNIYQPTRDNTQKIIAVFGITEDELFEIEHRSTNPSIKPSNVQPSNESSTNNIEYSIKINTQEFNQMIKESLSLVSELKDALGKIKF